MNKLFRFLIFAFVIPPLLFACSNPGMVGQKPGRSSMLQPGAKIGDMVITTGAKEAAPLWAFCSSVQDEENTTTSSCNVPSLHDLGIGCIFTMGARRLSEWDWSELTWEFFIDDKAVDLESFGIYETVLPALAHSPSPICEVFRQVVTWDVVLTNLRPGQHTLRGIVHTGIDTYTWLVYLTIEENEVGTRILWAGSNIQVTS